MVPVKGYLLLLVTVTIGCRIPDYREVKNLVQVTRYLSSARFDKEFQLRRLWAIESANPGYSHDAKERWVALQNAIWDFQSFHQSFFDVTLEQSETDIWNQPLAFYDSKIGKKLVRSLDIYYDQAPSLWRDYKDKDMPAGRRSLITELYFQGFDLGLEEDVARLLIPLFSEANYKVEHGRLPEEDDDNFKEQSARRLQKELRRIRRRDRTQVIEADEFREQAIRLSLMTDEDIALIIREQAKPENADMGKLERIAIAESMAFQLEGFLSEAPGVQPAAGLTK